MSEVEIPKWVFDLVKEGVNVTIEYDPDRQRFHIDLNSRAKSHMHLVLRDDQWVIEGRYDRVWEDINTLDDAIDVFLDCYGMREFGNSKWLELSEKRGLIEKVVEKKVSYKFT